MIEAGPLPVVRAQLTLLTVVFQNLLSNALKFKGDQPPRIDDHGRAVTGRSGCSPSPITESASSRSMLTAIFVIFQRLHDRAHVSGYRHRPGDVPEDHRVLRRPDLA